jgi:hypothetical protein
MKTKHLLVLIVIFFIAACARVPKESVELSATVGRDIAQVYKAHRNLAVVLYSRIKADVNKFIDDVYAPYQIQKLLQADYEDFKAGGKENLFYALDAAIKQTAKPGVVKEAVDAMDVFVSVVREEIESYRQLKLAPIVAQEKELLSAIDRSYNQIHYANSIVTGHLASIAKVHDAQEEVLKEFGLEGLREETADKLSHVSKEVAKFTGKAKKVEGTITEIEKRISALGSELDAIVNELSEKTK